MQLLSILIISTLAVVSAMDIEDVTVKEHDPSKWADDNMQPELSEVVVNGLAATTMKTNLEVKPETQIVNFLFYKWITGFLKKIQGVRTVRLASIIVHYKPHTDECKGTISYALVDKRFQSDHIMAQKGYVAENKKAKGYKVQGKIKQLVTIGCNQEAIIQMTMNHFVTVEDLKQIKLVQIVSNIDMSLGVLGSLSIGWKTIPGEATIYQYYPAQKYIISRLKMPELLGKSDQYVYDRIKAMAKERQKKEKLMLDKLQKIVDQQNVIGNDFEASADDRISSIDNIINQRKTEIENIDKILPKVKELKDKEKYLDSLEKEKESKINILKNPELMSEPEVPKVQYRMFN